MKYGHVCLLIYLNSPKSPRLTDCTFQTADGLLDPVGLQEARTSHRHSELLHSVLCWVSTVETPSPGPGQHITRYTASVSTEWRAGLHCGHHPAVRRYCRLRQRPATPHSLPLWCSKYLDEVWPGPGPGLVSGTPQPRTGRQRASWARSPEIDAGSCGV